MNDPKGLFKMKFVGKPDGKLMKWAPGNYIHGEVYMQPYRMSRFAFWELLEETPELIAPETTEMDDVFEEAFYIPDDESVVGFEGEVNLDLDVPASIEFSSSDVEVYNVDFTASEHTPPEEELDRDSLLEVLEKAGVEVKPRTRTTTLVKMVAELETKEES